MNPPGITWARAIGVVPGSSGSGKYGPSSAGNGAAVPVEAREERGLGLSYDGAAGDADHQVVEAAVLEVILDTGSARPGDRPVDHIQLAMLGVSELVLPWVETLRVRVEAVPVEREQVVDDDLGSRRPRGPVNIARACLYGLEPFCPQLPAPRRPP